MSVSAEERSLRRRLVYNAMPESASMEVINRSIEILENEFGDEPQIKYSQLIKRLSEAIDSNVKFGQVLRKIMIMRRKSPEEIGQDPGVQESNKLSVKLTPQDIVFNAMFSSIARQVRQRGKAYQTDFPKWINSNAGSWKLTSACESAIEEWSSSPESSSQLSGSVEQLQKIVNQCFVWMCNKFGPVDTDKILHQAIQAADRIPEAIEFPPKKLM